MAPEQLRAAANQPDARTDIFSLGVVLYRLLTGQLPFVACDAAELRRAILLTEPKPPCALNAAMPGKLERLCLKALAKEPDARYSTAKDFASDLQSVADTYRRRWFRRAAAGLAIGFIIAVGAWYGRPSPRPPAPAQSPPSADQMVAELRTWVESHPPQPLEQSKIGEEVFAEAMSKAQQITSPQEDLPSPRPENRRPGGKPPLPMFNAAMDLTGKALTESDCEAIGRHLLLRRLILAHTPTGDRHLPHLMRAPSLTYLDLSGTQVTDAGLKMIGNPPMLSHLLLAKTAITDAGLTDLSRLRLRTLDLEGTEITDAGLETLGDRYGAGGYLRELNLRNTKVGDGGLPSLKRLTRLQSLRVGGTRITEHGIKELQAAIPGCAIIQ